MPSDAIVLAYLTPESYMPLISWIVGLLGVVLSFGSVLLGMSLSCFRRLFRVCGEPSADPSDGLQPGQSAPRDYQPSTC